ncbi:MAG: protein containing Planctomycete extracellular domain protein [Planctomycetota bacterium]|nr:MAG: protein containing Planctomycete extracellular domain protein [Planctomycetota bacterium]
MSKKPNASLRPSTSRQRRGSARPLRLEALEDRRLLAALPYGAMEQDLGEFMLGSVAVTPVFLESNGQLDPSTEDWDGQKISEVLTKIDEGLDWWVDTLAAQSSVHQLSFTVDTTYATTPFETRYEAISRPSNDYVNYVSEFIAAVGFNQTGNLEADVRAFNHAQRLKLGTDWSFTIIVAPSWNDSDGQFDPGGSFRRAFSFAGGLFMVVPSTRPASTFTHEVGHMFWARDEYPGGGTYLQRRGYYNTQNLNAHDNPEPGFVQQPSIMAAGTLLDTAYANHTSPASTLAMIGWQDSDGDGIFDVMDVPHRLTGSGYFEPDSSTYFFDGRAVVQTLPNLNPSGLQNDITLNRIREIEYRFDDGPWQLYAAPNAYEVDLHMALSVPGGAQTIEIRARDSQTTVVSNVFHGRLSRPDQTVVPGINGVVWIDANRNGLWDVGEHGNPGWTIEVRDASGNPLDLRKVIEPDDYPAGQLSSGFNPDLTLSSVGTDVDGRVGVFNDPSASTGAMTFWGFSRSSQSFRSTWSDSSRKLQANFAQPTTEVSIDAVGAFDGARARIEAFNSAGQLVGRYTTAALGTGQAETMTIRRGTADIAYVTVGGHAGSLVYLDNLQFGPQVSAVTGDRGQYTLPALPAGNYTVVASANPPSSFNPLAPANGQLSAVVSPNVATTDVDFGFESSQSPWQNQANRFDVNNDSFVSAIDALLIINDINANNARDLRGSGLNPPPYVDVNGDSFVSALDALIVINFINSQSAGGGEGEAWDSWALDHGGRADEPSWNSQTVCPEGGKVLQSGGFARRAHWTPLGIAGEGPAMPATKPMAETTEESPQEQDPDWLALSADSVDVVLETWDPRRSGTSDRINEK